MEFNIKSFLDRIEKIYSCGLKEDGNHTRMAYSKEDVEARELFIYYGKDLGLESRIDSAGNIFLKLEGSDPSLPSILMGSHLDTVPDGGRYDGVVGCLAGLGVCEAYVKSNKNPKHSIEVVVFTDEEGYRFGKGLLGSSAICGENLGISKDDLDLYGNRREDVMKSYNIDFNKIKDAKRNQDSVFAFIEMHIEQGGVLDSVGIPIGLVTSIAGVSRYDVLIKGEANHAGSTRMADRKDALVSASKFICELPEIVKKNGGEYTVATVGTINVTPHSVNVIPGTCFFNLEIRDQSQEVMDLIEVKCRERLEEICKEKSTTLDFKRTSNHSPAPMNKVLFDEIKLATEKLGYDYVELPSGAFHDSLVMSERFRTAMIFVPSINGISHSRFENTDDSDLEKGCNVLLETIENVDSLV